MSALVASGFRQLSDHPRVRYFLPCSVGTFSNSLSKGTEGCTVCPPGKSCSDLIVFQPEVNSHVFIHLKPEKKNEQGKSFPIFVQEQHENLIQQIKNKKVYSCTL